MFYFGIKVENNNNEIKFEIKTGFDEDSTLLNITKSGSNNIIE